MRRNEFSVDLVHAFKVERVEPHSLHESEYQDLCLRWRQVREDRVKLCISLDLVQGRDSLAEKIIDKLVVFQLDCVCGLFLALQNDLLQALVNKA